MKATDKIIPFLVSLFILCSCEEDITPVLETVEPQIVIDAWINNSQTPQLIKINETVPYFDSTSASGVSDAIVYIENNGDNTRYDFTEKSPGVYVWMPSTDRPQIGIVYMDYTLNIEIGDKIILEMEHGQNDEYIEGEIILPSGYHRVSIKCYQCSAGSDFQVFWQTPGRGQQEINPKNMYWRIPPG